MKQLYFKVCAAWCMLATCPTLPAQTTAIPDTNFEQALINLGYDSGSPDGSVPTASISGLTHLSVNAQNIQDLSGIEDFTALKVLMCFSNQLSSIDVSHNLALDTLWCNDNPITSIDLSQNQALTHLVTRWTNITELNLSCNTALNYVNAEHGQLTKVNLANGNNQNLSADFRFNMNLNCIQVDSNALATIASSVSKDNTASFSANCGYLPCEELSVAEAKQELVALQVYPNPVHDVVHLQNTSGLQVQSISLYDMSGRIIRNYDSTLQSLSVQGISPGHYILQLNNTSSTIQTRIIIP